MTEEDELSLKLQDQLLVRIVFHCAAFSPEDAISKLERLEAEGNQHAGRAVRFVEKAYFLNPVEGPLAKRNEG